jgi:hypothetical protein
MVGTIAVFEALLLVTAQSRTNDEVHALDRGAQFLIERKLIHGSPTVHNAAERLSAEAWSKPCFPRFYLYDTLRGLNALLNWAEKRNQKIPFESISEAVSSIESRFPDGLIRNERTSFAGARTLVQNKAGDWTRAPAEEFSLLTRVSTVGDVNPFLTREWKKIRASIASLSRVDS